MLRSSKPAPNLRHIGEPPSAAQAERVAAALLGEEYQFLVGRLIDQPTLDLAVAHAIRSGTAPHEVMVAHGWILERDYCRALAGHFGLPCDLAPGSAGFRCIDAMAQMPSAIRAMMANGDGFSAPLALAAGRTGRSSVTSEPSVGEAALLQKAINGLRSHTPALSAAGPIWLWQILAFVALLGLVAGGALVEPDATVIALTALIALPFLMIVALRAVALGELALAAQPPWRRSQRRHHDDVALPVYSILVPLYREQDVLADLVDALDRLDYPKPKLDVILAIERDDTATLEAAMQLDLPGYVRIITVPPGEPRTKPKALNYALAHARGDYIVVYDAEDVPEPDQLRLALAAFQAGGERLACVQARLNIHNPQAGWLSRQFTLEYSALFDAMLPALARLGLPVPLGGTSNHFPRRVLEQAGAWDPFNVTEDADLGIRIARRGGQVAVLPSTTWEEAPNRLGPWLRQRTRWMKGWLQTYLVHMRAPLQLASDLGTLRFLGLQALVGGIILSALVHPWFYVLAGVALWRGDWLSPSTSTIETVMWWIAGTNLLLGYLSAIFVGALAVVRRGKPHLASQALLMPAYWLLISCAAYRALWQLAVKPYLWEKTDHAPRSRRRSMHR